MKIDAFAGIQNTVGVRDIADNSLQDAVNVDIDNAGALIQRKGYVLSKSVTIDAAHVTGLGETFLVTGGKLCRVDEGLNLHTLCDSTASEFSDSSQFLFTNDGFQIHRETAVNLKTVTAMQPEALISSGSWPIGQYSILVTYTNADGLEGGASNIVTVELITPGEILINYPEFQGHEANVYMTEADDDVFIHQVTGAKLMPVQLGANGFPEEANLIEYHESQMYITQDLGDNTVVLFSKPLHFHLFDLEKDYFVVPGKILRMRSAGSALIIGTESEVFAYQDGVLEALAGYGVVPGRSMILRPDGRLMIHTVQGLCSAMPFEAITQDKVSLPMGSVCSAALMDQGGIQRYIGLHDGQGTAYNNSF